MKDKKNKTGTEMLEELTSFAYETDEFPSTEVARKILAEEKIDTTQLNSWAIEKLKGIKARQLLAQAKLKRMEALEILERCRSSIEERGFAIREKVLEKLRVLASSDPEAAQIYCRKFEEAPDEDLADLEAELMALDELGNGRDGS